MNGHVAENPKYDCHFDGGQLSEDLILKVSKLDEPRGLTFDSDNIRLEFLDEDFKRLFDDLG